MKSTQNLQQFWSYALKRRTLLRSLRIAISVGSLYNLINQGDVLLAEGFGGLNYVKLSLTYITPFIVATYASASTHLHLHHTSQ